jgi:hypothetical protein
MIKFAFFFLFFLTSCSISLSAFSQEGIDSASSPAIFAPGVVSTRHPEWGLSLTPHGKTVFFTTNSIYPTICYSFRPWFSGRAYQ